MWQGARAEIVTRFGTNPDLYLPAHPCTTEKIDRAEGRRLLHPGCSMDPLRLMR